MNLRLLIGAGVTLERLPRYVAELISAMAERFSLVGLLLIAGCAGLSQGEEGVPEETIRRFVGQELATQPFYIDQLTLDPETTGEPERKWRIDFYYEKRAVAPDICVATQLSLWTAKREATYEIEDRETTPLVALEGCDRTDERNFILAFGELSDQEIRRAAEMRSSSRERAWRPIRALWCVP